VADPSSWLMIEPGWEVVGVDGAKLGRVDAVLAERVGEIVDDLITLKS
jgi:hypothetical protein